MDSREQRTIAAGILARYRQGRLSRRETPRMLAGIGLAGAGVGAIGLGTIATRATAAPPSAANLGFGGHGGLHAALLRQDAGTPAAEAPPPLGEQPDGTHLWRERVAGMDMENLIDLQAFFPSEITINAGVGNSKRIASPPGFHTVTFLSGGDVPPRIIPDESAEPASPAAGPPPLTISPEAAFPSGGDTYDGTGYVNSGVDVVRLPGDPPSSSPSPRPEPTSTSASPTAW